MLLYTALERKTGEGLVEWLGTVGSMGYCGSGTFEAWSPCFATLFWFSWVEMDASKEVEVKCQSFERTRRVYSLHSFW